MSLDRKTILCEMFDTATLPNDPGCYLFFDKGETVIYVGKAKNLRKRVSSYFQKKDHDVKTRSLVSGIARVSVMVTNTETEALLLENNLIKKHQPKYNIDLKDAKRYAYIELDNRAVPSDRDCTAHGQRGSLVFWSVRFCGGA